MTVICRGGASESRPGFNQTVVITSTAVESALILLGFPALAAVISPFVVGEAYDLTTFCTVDPPPDPGLTALDILDVTNFTDPTVSIPAIDKIRQWFKSWYWYQVCQCSDGLPPSVGAPTLSNPGGVSTNPALPSGSPIAPCFEKAITVPASTQGHIYTELLWSDGGTPLGDFDGNRKLPAGTTKVTVHGVSDGTGAKPVDGVYIGYTFSNSAGFGIGTFNNYASRTPGRDETWSITPPSGSVAVSFTIFFFGGSPRDGVGVTGNVFLDLRLDCTSATQPTLSQPCCPPDPLLETKLNQILGLLQSVYLGLPTPIHSYADGTAHAGLSGNGTVTLVGEALAVRVNVTTEPSSLGEVIESPTFHFDHGYIVPVVNAAPVRGETRLVYNPQMFPLPPLTEQIGYSLHPGVVVTITEQLRGP